ncbi:hypothetical protein BJX64DRAFT_248660 [Aspergillus heterothallicus]
MMRGRGVGRPGLWVYSYALNPFFFLFKTDISYLVHTYYVDLLLRYRGFGSSVVTY